MASVIVLLPENSGPLQDVMRLRCMGAAVMVACPRTELSDALQLKEMSVVHSSAGEKP